MIKNYLKIAWRNLLKHKSFSLINIFGLAIGMASAILILLLIENELSFDQFHEKKDRIYLLYNRAIVDGKLECSPGTPMVMSPLLKSNYPQVEEITRINPTGPIVLSVNDKLLIPKGLIVDGGFLNIFSYPLKEGNTVKALESPRSIVITESFAKKLFKKEEALGKIIKVDSNAYFRVTGVLKDLPINTEFNFEYLLPWSYTKEIGWENQNWEDDGVWTVVLLKPGVTEKIANDRFRDIIKINHNASKNEIFLHPITKWRLWSRFENGKIVGGNIENIRIYGMLAGFILFIACINYMNLSTARSVKRGKEVGVLKVVGASRFSIILRFLGESLIISFLSVILCVAIVQVSIEGFDWLTWSGLCVPYRNIYFWCGILGFTLFTGLIAGSYPAFYLSSFRPITVLKGSFKTSNNLVSFRKMLVVLQFSIAITFIICTIIIYQQIDFGSKRDPGYNRDRLAFVYANGEINRKYASIRNELLSSATVTAVTRSNSPISYTWNGSVNYSWVGSNPNEKTWIEEFHIDNDFVETMGLKVISGREINTIKYPGDSTAILLNESAVKQMGFKDPIGQIVRNDNTNWVVVGVIKNFIVNSPFSKIPPMVLQGPKNWFGTITFRLKNKNSLAENMNKVEAIFKKYVTDYPIISAYVDEQDAQKLENERRTGIQSALFGGLAILICCLGLFALAAYTAESRIKEIGIRKVLGATVSGIIILLSKDFVKLVIISFVIAFPSAWWFMHSWLQNYTYRINISWSVFMITGLFALGIAVATVSSQAFKAAIANPVKSLRSE